MFGFLKKRVLREQEKLACQSFLAISYISGYYSKDETKELEGEFFAIKQDWQYGDKMPSEKVQAILDFNMKLRRLYDQSAGSMLNSFDKEFTPLKELDSFYEQHGLK